MCRFVDIYIVHNILVATLCAPDVHELLPRLACAGEAIHGLDRVGDMS